MKNPVRKSVVARLASADEQFADIERLTKERRKRLDRVAETIRSAAEELRRIAKAR
jgi:hypothetical protein